MSSPQMTRMLGLSPSGTSDPRACGTRSGERCRERGERSSPDPDDPGERRALASAGVESSGSADAVAQEQAALRRVATLVASGAEPAAVFGMVAEEAGRLLRARSSATIRYDGDTAVTVGRWQDGEAVTGFEVGTIVPLAGSDGMTAVVARTGRSARIDDYDRVRGRASELMRANGYRAAVGAPIVAGGRTWGLLLVASASPEGLPADAERRLGDFAELVALGSRAPRRASSSTPRA